MYFRPPDIVVGELMFYRDSTLCVKKVPTFKLSLTLSNLNRFSKFLHCWKAYEICYKTYDITYLTLSMLLHCLGKLKIYFFAYIQQTWKKMHFNRL